MGPHSPPRLQDQAPEQGARLVVDERSRDMVRTVRPMAWAVLEAVALEAVADGHDRIAHTSARRVAELLGLDPGTTAAALRLLRQRGLVELRQTSGSAGRFGLSAYLLGDIAGLEVLPRVDSPPVVAAHAGDPDAVLATATALTPAERTGKCTSSTSPRSAAQGAFDLGLDTA